MVKNTIKVYGRIKCSNKKSATRNYSIRQVRDYQEIVFTTDKSGDHGFYKNSKHRFRFCTLFDESSTQADVFDVIAKPVVNSVLQGYNGTVFAYGQTGSGKTYSMTGSSEYDTRGIIPRTIQHIFNYIKNSTTVIYNIYISYLEIYNETGYDLLNPRHRTTYLEELPRVNILEDAKGQTHLRNLGVISVASEREAMCLLFMGDTNRTIAETPMNMYSSRSHCIFTVHVAATMTEDGRVRRSKLHLVDLAGSERIQKSQISGTMLVDAKLINLSLHYLEQVIIALSDEKRNHVPYRNSMMTTVLRDSLGGNCLTAMLATMSVDSRNFEETLSTCKFAQRVALVSSEAHINEEEDPETKISQLKMEIENLKKELVLYKDSSTFRFKLQDKTELTPAQVKECENQVTLYLKNSTDNFPVELDPYKIQIYFKVFKRIIQSQTHLINNDKSKTFEEIIKQKDSEITILANLLNKEKLKTKFIEKSSVESIHESPLEISAKNMSNLTERKAFELFMRNEQNKSELNKCAAALKQKISIAKDVASRIYICKNNIVSLKVKLRENINNQPEVANKFMSQLKIQQDFYKENLIKLRKLKTETDHLNHGFQQAKLKMMKRFNEWWMKINMETSTFVENQNIFQQNPNTIQMHKNVNAFNYTKADNISLNSDTIEPQFSQNFEVDLTLDTFPPFYEEDSRSYKSFQTTNVPTTTDDYNQQAVPVFSNQTYENEYLQSTSNYVHQNQTEVNQNYYFDTITDPGGDIPQYSQSDNIHYQYNVADAQPSFSNNYNHYSIPVCNKNNQSALIDFNLPEKLPNKSEILYQKFHPIETSAEQFDGNCCDLRMSSDVETNEIPEERQYIVMDNTSSRYLDNIPLTGDPEVDEEIIAFYRAKQNIITSNNK